MLLTFARAFVQHRSPSNPNDDEAKAGQAISATRQTVSEPHTTSSFKRIQTADNDAYARKFQKRSHDDDTTSRSSPQASEPSSRKRKQTRDGNESARKSRKYSHQDNTVSVSLAEASDISSRKRRRQPDTESNVSKVPKHRHGDLAASWLTDDRPLNIKPSTWKTMQDTGAFSPTHPSRRKPRDGSLDKKQTGAMRKCNLEPSANDIFGSFVRKQKKAAES